jgi:hypothetical protein
MQSFVIDAYISQNSQLDLGCWQRKAFERWFPSNFPSPTPLAVSALGPHDEDPSDLWVDAHVDVPFFAAKFRLVLLIMLVSFYPNQISMKDLQAANCSCN